MKTKILSFVLLLTCSLSLFAVDLKWRQINYNPQQDLRSVFAIGKDTAFIAGAQGAILRTTDDAKSWTRTDIAGTPQLNSIRFATLKIGFVAGNGGVILKTTDGGDHWTSLNSGTSLAINALAIPKLSNIWAAGDSGLVIHSVDSGRTWSRIDTIVKNKEKIVMAEYRQSKIRLIAKSGTIYSKPDNGLLWYNENVPFPYGNYLATTFLNDSAGFGVGVEILTGGSTQGGTIFLDWTYDYGKNRDSRSLYGDCTSEASMESAGIHFSNDTTGYIVSGNVIAKVLRRSDDLTPLKEIEYSPKIIITNLSRGVIRIKSNESPLLSAQVYNSGGSQLSVLQSKSELNELTINVSSLTNGVYIIRTLMSDGSSINTKWVKR